MKWDYTYISMEDEIIVSGWKLYIFGKDIKDANYVKNKLTDVCRIYDATIKIATPDIIARNIKLKPAWGVAVIYLHASLFRDEHIRALIEIINTQLADYQLVGHYQGSKPLSRVISCRYDISIPTLSHVGLSYDEYLLKYRGEYGLFNIEGNDIPKEFGL